VTPRGDPGPDECSTGPTEAPARRRGRRAVFAALTAVVVAAGVSAALVAGSNHQGRTGGPRAAAAVRVAASGSSTTGGLVRPSIPARTATSATSGASGGASRPEGTSAVASGRSGVSQIRPSGAVLVIPALGVRAPLIPTGAVGAPETAALTIPTDIHTVGWWDGTVSDGDRSVQENAPAPGQPGVALIAGHVDSAAAGPGALHDLGTLQVGDVIRIDDSTGGVSTWSVAAPPQTNLKTQLPPALWVTTGAPRLALVTCGGPFDPATGHYLDNVIVWASQVT
jgi:hypothetical protein